MTALTAQQACSYEENGSPFPFDLSSPEEAAQLGAKAPELGARVGGELQSEFRV